MLSTQPASVSRRKWTGGVYFVAEALVFTRRSHDESSRRDSPQNAFLAESFVLRASWGVQLQMTTPSRFGARDPFAI